MATATDMTVGGAPHGNMDIVMELFSGSCGSLTSIACGDAAGQGAPDDPIATGLTVGNTYYLRVYDFRTQYARVDPSYDLCVVEGMSSHVEVVEMDPEHFPGSIYPNPTNGAFTIHVGKDIQQVHVRIIDATGLTIVQGREAASGGLVRMSLGGQAAAGIYLVRVNDGHSIQEARLVIE